MKLSHYAPMVRNICEFYAGLTQSAPGNQVDEIINKAIPFIFNVKFPIFNEEYRNTLCHKILRHYYMREIGFETVGEWVLELNTRMLEIMPKYNLLYGNDMGSVSPLGNYYRQSTRNTDGSTDSIADTTDTNSTESQQKTVAKHLDTPQGSVEEAADNGYLTSGDIETADTTNNSTATAKSTVKNTNSNQETLFENGFNGITLASSILEFAHIYNDVDVLIIKDLDSLFCQLWG